MKSAQERARLLVDLFLSLRSTYLYDDLTTFSIMLCLARFSYVTHERLYERVKS